MVPLIMLGKYNYLNKIDIRDYAFMILPNEMENIKSRYELLKRTISRLKPISILDEGKKEVLTAKELLKKYRINLDNNCFNY
jgi:hypothetical protein